MFVFFFESVGVDGVGGLAFATHDSYIKMFIRIGNNKFSDKLFKSFEFDF